MCDGRRHTLGWQLDHHLSNLGRTIDFPTQMQLIEGCDMLTDALSDSMQADCGDMVLGAGVMTAADLDADIFQILMHQPGRKYLCERPCESLGRGDPQTARVGAWAGNNVFDQFGAWIGQTL